MAKNPLAARRATSYAERLRLGIAVIHGEVKEGDEDELDGRASPPPSVPASSPNDDNVSSAKLNTHQQNQQQQQQHPSQSGSHSLSPSTSSTTSSSTARANSLMLAHRVTSVGATLPPLTAKEKPPINVVGDVGGKIAIMVDDLIDDVQSFVDAAHVLRVSDLQPRVVLYLDSSLDIVPVFRNGAPTRSTHWPPTESCPRRRPA